MKYVSRVYVHFGVSHNVRVIFTRLMQYIK